MSSVIQMTNDIEEQALADLIRNVVGDPSFIVEIGTFKGHQTRFLSESFPITTIFTVDLYPGLASTWGIVRNVGECFQDCKARIVQIYRNSFEEIPIFADVWIVDADHSEEGCRKDSELAMQYASKLIVWHDFTNPWLGVKDAVPKITGGKAQRLGQTCFAYLVKE